MIDCNYMQLVAKKAAAYCAKTPPNIEYGDLLGAGYLGLLDALSKRKQDNFDSYVRTRINGAIVDELRRQSWHTRDTKKRALKQLRELLDDIE